MEEKIYNKGAVVFQEGDVCTSLGYLIDGELNISSISSFDNEYHIKTIMPNQYFGSFLLFSENPFYQGDIICTKSSKILFYSKKELEEKMKNSEFFNQYLSFLSKEHLETQIRYKILSQKKIKDRIFLYYHLFKKDSEWVSIPTIAKWSNFLGIPRPSLSRELILLEKKGILERKKGAFKIK